MGDRFDNKGMLIMPVSEFKKGKSSDKQRFVLMEVFCVNGHNLIDKNHEINGYPGIRLKFKRPGIKGEFVISAIEDDFEKIFLSGKLEKNKKYDLFCPFCNVKLPVLTNCNCQDDAELVVLGLTPYLDFNNAVTFCNVTGCNNGSFIKSGEALTHSRLHGK
jgi:hypothetical protein